MEQIIEFSPAYDKRDPDPSKNYGIHGTEIRFVLKGEGGAVQFLLQEEMDSKALIRFPHMFHKPQPADLGYHSPKPIYEGQELITNSCPYLDGKPCYYDGSGLNAERIYEILVREGSEGV